VRAGAAAAQRLVEAYVTVQGSASVEINRDPAAVFSAIADVTRMGEWSPECVAARWVGDATGPVVGAEFEGDNCVALFGVTVKQWTTTSEVTACVPGEVFEFVAEGYTTWRYRLEPRGTGTKVTESYEYTSQRGVRRFVYEMLLRRPTAMVNGMERTLERIKRSVESQ
jgi:Polyketide cyclase / dehydrase and lipid transport